MRATQAMVAFLGLAVLGGLAAPTMAQNAGGTPPAGQGGGGGGRNNGGGGWPGGGGRMDPAQRREQMLTRIKDQMGATDEEWAALKPKVDAMITLQMQAGGRGMMGGGGRNRGGNAQAPQGPTSPVADASAALQATLENKDSTADQIKAKLTTLREVRAKAKEELAAAQKGLRELLSVRQEAVLVSMGMLD